MSFKVGVKTPGDSDWVYNQLRFATRGEAELYAAELAQRWTSVQATHVEESEEKVNRE